jgi:hypothetical protein
MSFSSNKVNLVCSLRKIQTQVFCCECGQNGHLGQVLHSSSSEIESAKTLPIWVLDQTRWIGCVRCGKFNYKFFVENMARTGIPSKFRTIVPSKTESAKTLQTWVLGQTRWIGCVHCEKFNCKFFDAKVARSGISGMFRTIVPSKTEVPKRTKHEC